MSKKGKIKSGYFLAFIISTTILVRILVGEISTVPTGSMEPTIMIGDWVWINKLTYGAKLPARFADIPIVNIFTWKKEWRESDSIRDWGYRRFIGLREPRENDIIVFYRTENRNELLVKRIAKIIRKNKPIKITPNNIKSIREIAKQEGHSVETTSETLYIRGVKTPFYTPSQDFYYVLGDNTNNSIDSRTYGYIPQENIIGKVNRVLFSIDSSRKIWHKLRWKRILKKIKNKHFD